MVKAKLTGWKSYEINIVNSIEKYYGFQVIGVCGKLFSPKDEGFITGYKFNIDSWDCSDFFIPEEKNHIFCTEKVLTLFQSNNIQNYMLTDISTFKWYSVGEEDL